MIIPFPKPGETQKPFIAPADGRRGICPTCTGRGLIKSRLGRLVTEAKCITCNGSGRV